MIIETTVKMTLEEPEINALKTLKETYIQCLMTEQLCCDDCPLMYADKWCIAKYADDIINRRGIK